MNQSLKKQSEHIENNCNEIKDLKINKNDQKQFDKEIYELRNILSKISSGKPVEIIIP